MAIKVGDRIPPVALKAVTAEGTKDVKADELFAGKKVVLFALPGAFTPTCSAQHLPGYVTNAGALKEGRRLIAPV
jgi:peroxiredoxin